MSKFKVIEFPGAKKEPDKSEGAARVREAEHAERVVRDFKWSSFRGASGPEYSTVKAKYGPLATTDRERSGRPQKDRQFALSPLLKDALSVEEEENRILEDKVRAKVQLIENEARERAERAGYQEGMRKGYEKAFEKIQGDGSKSLQRFDHLIGELEKAKYEVFKANEKFLIELIYRIAKMVILRELTTDKEYLLRLATKLIDQIGVKDHITIKINPEDGEALEMMKKGLEKDFLQLTNLNIEFSNQVSVGGCRVETEWNALDSKVQTQLDRIYEVLLGSGQGEGLEDVDSPGAGSGGGGSKG